MIGWLDSVLNIGSKIIDRVIPDKEKAAAAKLKMVELHQSGELKTIELQMQAIVAEAKSPSKITL